MSIARLTGQRVLVTGATGFLGTRLCERLTLDVGAYVTGLVRSYAKCARLARLPVTLAKGDVRDREAVRRAVAECDVVLHCAYGSSGTKTERRETTVEGTRHVLDAAHEAGARVVHVSTVAVYGQAAPRELDESAPRVPSGSSYGETKLLAENLALAFAADGRAAVTVAQPTVIYGPHAPVWTEAVLAKMRSGRVVLLEGEEGLCNAVYVDDVVDGLLRAATRDEALGEAILLSGPEPVTWRRFYQAYESMLGGRRTISLSVDAARELARPRPRSWALMELMQVLRDAPEVRRRLADTREGRLAARLVRPLRDQLRRRGTKEANTRKREWRPQREAWEQGSKQLPIHPLSPFEIDFYRQAMRVQTGKASSLLGYRPAFSLDHGMRLTEQWARWSNLLGHVATEPLENVGEAP